MSKQTKTLVSDYLRGIASDPMWADHVEVRKETLMKAASCIEVLTRLLNSYVADDDERHEGFDPANDDFPTKDESRKAEAVALLRTIGAQPRSIA